MGFVARIVVTRWCCLREVNLLTSFAALKRRHTQVAKGTVWKGEIEVFQVRRGSRSKPFSTKRFDGNPIGRNPMRPRVPPDLFRQLPTATGHSSRIPVHKPAQVRSLRRRRP